MKQAKQIQYWKSNPHVLSDRSKPHHQEGTHKLPAYCILVQYSDLTRYSMTCLAQHSQYSTPYGGTSVHTR